LVTGACADLEHFLDPAQAQRLGHRRHDERLRDRLAERQGQRAIVPRLRGVLLEHEHVARNRRDRREHAPIGDPLLAQSLDQSMRSAIALLVRESTVHALTLLARERAERSIAVRSGARARKPVRERRERTAASPASRAFE
jgi:hypothetical protein